MRKARALALAVGLGLLIQPAASRAQPRVITIEVPADAALDKDEEKEARRLEDEARRLSDQGRPAAAIPLAERAAALRERSRDPSKRQLANTLSELAALHGDTGDFARAEALHLRALAILEKTRGQALPDLAAALHNLGFLHDEMGDYKRAEKLYRRALTILENARGPDHPDVAGSLNNLAAAQFNQGDYLAAERLYDRALSIHEKRGPSKDPRAAVTLTNIAVLRMSKGEWSGAIASIHRALAIFEEARGPDHPEVASSLNILADIQLHVGDLASAEVTQRRALTILETALGADHHHLAAALGRLGAIRARRGDHGGAEPLYRRALAITEKALGPEHPEAAAHLAQIGALLMAKDELTAAEPVLLRALAVREKSLGPAHPSVAASLYALAKLRLRQGRAGDAIAALARSTDIQERHAALLLSTGSEAQKRAYVSTLGHETSLAVSLHAQQSPADPSAARLALTTILRRKGRVSDAMADSLARLRSRLGAGDTALLERLASVQSQLSAQTMRGPRSIPLAQHRANLLALETQRQELEAEASRQSEALRVEVAPVTLDAVQAAIPSGAALVEIFAYTPFPTGRAAPTSAPPPQRYVAYVLRREGGAQMADLGDAASIDALSAKLRAALADPARDPRPLARSLHARIMEPIRALLGETRWLYLSPDGELSLVPWGALADEDGRYLVESTSITYLPSGRDLLRYTAPAAPPREPPLVIGNPDFGPLNLKATRGLSLEGGGESGRAPIDMARILFQPLDATAEEALAIARTVDRSLDAAPGLIGGVDARAGLRVLMGADATEAAVKAVKGPLFVHLATHGFFLPATEEQAPRADGPLVEGDFGFTAPRPENPLLRAGLALAGANARSSGAEDGVLTALEAAGLDLRGTKLAVLSACETGLGHAQSGAGVYGLRRALAIAGSESQVMSLWRVDDAATRDLMILYYARLMAGGGRSESLRSAQLAMLAMKSYAHPYSWAGFIASGNGATLSGALAAPGPATPPGKVQPGPRGCGCMIPGSAGDDLGEERPWIVITAAGLALALIRARCLA